jgi:predicted AAA+ superfamily ATPase
MEIDCYFWRTKADAELDFLTDYEGVLLPIEVKAADNTKAKSLHLFCSRYKPKMAIKTSLKNVGDNMDGETHVWSIPLYVLFRIKGYIFHNIPYC